MTAIKMTNIHKSFPGVKAVDGVKFDVRRGEIHGLVGENGAGKSSLMNMLYGVLQPDEGTIELFGEKVEISSPQEAMRHRIGMVHQHFMLVPSLSVLRNIVLGNPYADRIFIKEKSARAKIEKIMERYGMWVDLDAKIYQLSVGEKQRVEIIKALYRDVEILILDEPTAVLTPQETEDLFIILKKLKNDGCSIIFISHKLKEVLSITDRITVMCKGIVTGRANTSEVNEETLCQMMVGRSIDNNLSRAPYKPGKDVLTVENLSSDNDRGLLAVNNVTFSVKEGEVLGIAGVEGNGQTELLEVIMGLRPAKSGDVFINGKSLASSNVRKRRQNGISYIPEDRLKTGSAKVCSIKDNAISNFYYTSPYALKGVLQNKNISQFVHKLVENYSVKTPTIEAAFSSLSGGNMQKVILAREIEVDPEILIASQPTRGVDIGGIEFIHSQILKLRDESKAILLVSAELDEIFALSDRIIVLYEGEIVGEFDPSVSESELGLYMTGAKRHEIKQEAVI